MLPNVSNDFPEQEKNPILVSMADIEALEMEDYGLTPIAVKKYMYGLDVVDPKTEQPIDDEFYQSVLENAVAQTEQELDIAIFPRFVNEHHDYNSVEFNSYMYTHVYKRPIIQVEKLNLGMNSSNFYTYPRQWWNVYNLAGHIEVLPTPLMQTDSQYGAMTPNGLPLVAGGGARVGYNSTFAPQMINVQYIAGMLPRKHAMHHREWEMPATLEKLIIKYAVREIFQVWGRLLVQPGIANTSISMDGISESMGTTQSAMYSAVSADVAQINSDIEELKKALLSYFGTNFTTF